MNITTPIRRSLRRSAVLRNWRFGFRSLRYAGNDAFLVSPCEGVRMMARQADLKIIDEVFRERRYATLFPFRREATIVDIGAHCGSFSVFAGVQAASNARIVAVEPDGENYQLAEKNLEMNALKNVTLLPCGVSGETGTIQFFRKPGASAQHSIHRPVNGPECPTIEINVLSMRDLFHRHNLNRCEFMKLDCEGAEYPFLYQAPDDILRSITTISMEFHDMDEDRSTGAELAGFLASKGFSIVELRSQPTRHNRSFGTLLVTRKW